MFKIRAKSTLMALVLAIAAMLFAMGGIVVITTNAAENTDVSVRYYNGGFWAAMMTNNDFKNNLKGVVFDKETDALSFNADVDAPVTAWGPADYIPDEYCNWSEAKSLVVEVVNHSDSVADFRMFFSGYTSAEKTAETHLCAGGGKTYYYKAKNGIVSQSSVGTYSAGGLNIPANFDGYIVIPTSEITGYWDDSEVSLACIKRINFQFDADWSKGEVTFGKVGYALEEGAEIAGSELKFSPMIEEKPFEFDEYDNDVKYVKNWLYNLNTDYLAGELKKADGAAELKLAEDADELEIAFADLSADVYLWCDNFTAEDTDLSQYRYFLLDVKNHADTPLSLGFVLTTGLENPNKTHFGFLPGGVRLVARNEEAGNLAPEADTDGYFVTVPALFDGYLAFEMNADKMYATTLSDYSETFNPKNVGSVNLFLKNGTSGDFSLGRPLTAKSNKILDTRFPIEETIDNDTESARFRLFGQSKTYDGKPLDVSVSKTFENACTITWYLSNGSEEIPLSEVPVNAGEYIVRAKATDYLYTAELRLSILRADPTPLIILEERTYYAGETIKALSLADNSIAGTLTVTPVTLEIGENTVNFYFVPESENYSSISASCNIIAVERKSPADLIKFEKRTYYAGETLRELHLAKDSIAGIVSVQSIKLSAGENTLHYTFTPDSPEYEVYNGTLIIMAENPVYTIEVSDKIFDGKIISVTVSGYPFEYTLIYYKKAENGEYEKISDAPSETGEYKVVLSSAELGEGKSKEFKIIEKSGGCAGRISAFGGIEVLFAVTAILGTLILNRGKRTEKNN